jgi:hypothetical protein
MPPDRTPSAAVLAAIGLIACEGKPTTSFAPCLDVALGETDVVDTDTDDRLDTSPRWDTGDTVLTPCLTPTPSPRDTGGTPCLDVIWDSDTAAPDTSADTGILDTVPVDTSDTGTPVDTSDTAVAPTPDTGPQGAWLHRRDALERVLDRGALPADVASSLRDLLDDTREA